MYSPKWNRYFMDIALRTSELSKDCSTKVGAVIVKDKHILSIGYNGAPKGFPDEEVPLKKGESLTDSKNTFMVHAEANAILNYRGNLDDLRGSTLYVTVSPCHECAKLLSQVGIDEVIYLSKYHDRNCTDASDLILEKCGVNVYRFDENLS